MRKIMAHAIQIVDQATPFCELTCEVIMDGKIYSVEANYSPTGTSEHNCLTVKLYKYDE